MISILENFRHWFWPKPSAMPSVTLPFPTVHDAPFQHSKALSSFACGSVRVARAKASWTVSGRLSSLTSAWKALLTVSWTAAGSTSILLPALPFASDEDPLDPPSDEPQAAVKARAAATTTVVAVERARVLLPPWRRTLIRMDYS